MSDRSNGSTLLWLLTRQELRQRYSGSLLGVSWLFVTPVLMVAVYFLVFGEVMRAKWPGVDASRKDLFALNLFAGLVAFQLFADAVSRSATVITGQPNYVKKVVFPLALLPAANVLVACISALAALAVLLVFAGFALGRVPWGALWLPLVLGPIVVLAMAFSLLFGSLGVFFRDLSQVLGPVLSAMMFLSPIFFPLSQVPAGFRWLFELNPLAIPIEQFRAVLFLNTHPDGWSLVVAWAVALALLGLGSWWFRRTQRSFADVL